MDNNIAEFIASRVKVFFNPYKENFHEFNVEYYNGLVEVHINETKENLNRAIVLRVAILEEYKQLHITNIFMTESLRYKGLGKKLISLLFEIAQEYNYELFVVDMVQSFYKKLIGRGAVRCDEEEAVQITIDTNLD